MAGTLHDQEYDEHQHDTHDYEDDQLIDRQGETGEPSGAGRGQFESGVIRTDRQEGVGGENGMAIEEMCQGGRVVQLIEAGQEEWVAHGVRGKEPQTENERHQESLFP